MAIDSSWASLLASTLQEENGPSNIKFKNLISMNKVVLLDG